MFCYDRFEALRSASGITKKFIAESLGRTPTICQDWKNGKSIPNADQLEVVANILNTTPEYLRGESDKIERPASGIGGGLEGIRKEAWELIQKMDDETLRRFIAAARVMLGE